MIRVKKAVSLMVAYILLIVITLGLAVMIYSWLESKVTPPDIQDCPDDISLIVQDYSCSATTQEIELTLKNKGRHDITGFILRGAETANAPIIGYFDILSLEGGVYLEDTGNYYFSDPLSPEATQTLRFSYADFDTLEKIQIEPTRNQEGKNVLCDDSIVELDVSCGVQDGSPESGSGEPASLVSWWKFDEESGETIATDSSTNNYDAILQGAADFVSGNFENALDTNPLGAIGSNSAQIGTTPENLKIRGDITITSWVNIDSLNDNNYIISDIEGSNKKYALAVNSAGNIVFYWNNIEIPTTATISPDTWTYVTVTKNGIRLMVSVDGTSFGPYYTVGAPTLASDYIAIGWPGSDMLIDELKVYDESISP